MKVTEHRIQVGLFKWAKLASARHPELALLFAIPNGGARDPITGAMLKAEGVKRGVPDLFLPAAAGTYHGLFLEMKTASGRLSPEQHQWQHGLVEATDGKKRAIGGRERIIYTTHSAAYDAKNRHGLPESMPMCWASFAPIFGAFTKPGAVSAPVTPAPVGPITKAQIEQIELYWKTLKKPAADKTKAFEWLGCDTVSGDEHWTDLSAAQAERLIGLLQKKMNEIGAATSAQVAAAGKAVLA